jgi:hypothetical protein
MRHRTVRRRTVRRLAPALACALSCGLAGGCGEPAPPPPAAASPAVTSITVTVARATVRPPARRVRVARGTAVRITVTSDTAEEFHLHGYDRTLRLAPGRPGTLTLTADRPGVFEAELHGSRLRLFELRVG